MPEEQTAKPRRAARLTALQVQRAGPGRHMDGGGLMLVVTGAGGRSWVLRTMVRGKRRDIGVGSAAVLSLAEAREEARRLRAVARAGGDPIADRQARQDSAPAFEEVARKVHADLTPGWRNPKHAAQWLSSLETYAFPHIGRLPVDQVGLPEVRRVLAPIWTAKPETGRRVRQRVGQVLDWAHTQGHRQSDNPTRIVHTGLPAQPKGRGSHAALPYDEIPAFVQRLRTEKRGKVSPLALEFLILTVVRTGNVIAARWPEIDLDAQTWTIPKMKTGREFVVPLAPRAIEILEAVRSIHSGRGDFVFERSPGKGFSNGVFLSLVKRMEVDATPHGTSRSGFIDWGIEQTTAPREVREAALDHVVEDKTERAYLRSNLLERRRALMRQWADFIEGVPGKVIHLQGAVR